MTKISWILGIAAVALAGAHVGPLMWTHPDQDACSFGDVSNEEYRSLLSRASLGFWRPFVWNDDAVSAQLSKKYLELAPVSANASMKVAAAHAVMRALGANFQRLDDFRNPIRDASIQRTLGYRYLLDINRLFYFAPIYREMMITVIIDDPFQPSSDRKIRRELPMAAHFPNPMEGFYHFRRNRDWNGCPPVPTK